MSDFIRYDTIPSVEQSVSVSEQIKAVYQIFDYGKIDGKSKVFAGCLEFEKNGRYCGSEGKNGTYRPE